MSAAILLASILTQMSAPACHVMTKPVAAGEVVDAANTAPAACDEVRHERKVRYDPRARVVRAQAPLAAGEPLGSVFPPARPPVLAGTRIAVAVRVGPVTVSRDAVALQRAGAGQRFFVRGDDGIVFAAPALGGEQAR